MIYVLQCGGFSIDRLLAEYVVAKIDARKG